MKRFFSVVCAVVEKDLRVELRARESLAVMVMFSLLVLVLFSFAFGPDLGGKEGAPMQAGVLWVAILFASVLGLSRSMGMERESNGFSAMRLSPADPAAIYLGKLIAILILLSVMEVVGFAALAIFYRAPVGENLGSLALVAFVASFGIASVGTLFAAMTTQTRTRDILLPVLLFPLLVPVMIAAVKATAAYLNGSGWQEAGVWVKVLVAFDLIFLSVSVLVFEYAIEE